MLVSEMNGIRPVDAGRQDCHDLHSWGPGVRQCYIIHYIISGKGTFTCGKKDVHTYRRTELLICPEQVVQYAPDENEPWEYVWVDFVGGTMPADSGTVGTEPTAAGGAASPSGKASAVFLSVSARWNSIAGTARRPSVCCLRFWACTRIWRSRSGRRERRRIRGLWKRWL